MKYKRVVVGGTFDHFHEGHRAFLDKAFAIGEQVVVSITTDTFTVHKYLQSVIQPFSIRKKDVEYYLTKNNFEKRARIVELDDIYGITISDPDLDAIVVTSENRNNATKINKKRREKGYKKLAVIIVPFVKSSDHRIVSSSRVRMGEIARSGEVLRSYIRKNKMYLPSGLRHELRTPHGTIIKAKSDFTSTAREVVDKIRSTKPTLVISVGDIVTASLQDAGYQPDISVIDLKSQRKKIFSASQKKSSSKHYLNQQGTISHTAVDVLRHKMQEILFTHKKRTIYIRGEEDLLAIAAILLAPLQSLIVYGQKDVGIVMIGVTEEQKKYTIDLLNKFT